MQRKDFNCFSTFLLAQEAEKRGIKVTRMFPETKKSYLLLEKKGKTETIIGQRISKLDFNAYFICKNKELTRKFLQKNGIKTTQGKLFYKKDIAKAIKYAKEIGFPIVAKPSDSTWGNDVYLNLATEKEVLTAIKKILASRNSFLLEKEFSGEEYRITASNKELWGIINRIPANIIGNGKDTIKKLIELKNSDPRRGEGHKKSLVKITVDKRILSNLKKERMTMSTIPKNKEVIFLRKKSNLSTGGDSIDVTEKAHPKLKKLAPKIIASIPGLPYAGFDFLTPDITRDPEKVGYAVIEINDSPMLSMHHIPFKGEKRDIASKIIDMIFPEK